MNAATLASIIGIIFGAEGGYDSDPRDRGNWTGGQIGAGELRGTKWGISAAAYPALDIPRLSQADAVTIYRTDYWTAIAGDALPPDIALLVFDAAVNSGVSQSVRWLQRVLGVQEDGHLGHVTLQALTEDVAADPIGLKSRLLAARLVALSDAPAWRTYRGGWASRVCALPYHAATLAP